MYLDDWHKWDQPFSDGIFSSNKAQSLKAFHHAAKYYKLTRNFRIDETESSPKGIVSITTSLWFKERVFDKYSWFNAGN